MSPDFSMIWQAALLPDKCPTAALVLSGPIVFREARSILAESLWWDGRDGLHWCDIDAGTIHVSGQTGHVDGRDDRTLQLPPPVSAFQPLRDLDGFVFAGRDYVGVVENDQLVARIASFENFSDRIRLNEAKCDPAGRFIVGAMSLDHEPNTAIYSVDESGEVRTLIGGVGVSNGFEWSDDGSTMWFTDTATKTIYVGDYSGDGALSDVHVFSHGLMSDGLTRDASGGFWGGIYVSGSVAHWDANGDVDLEVDVPAGHVTSVAFGGHGLSTLFIATVRENLTESQLEASPLSGSLFRIETATHGLPVRAFGTPRKGN
ncbi:MAG TPA: SMP-30/gluconolactonase/LRE family protein [Galbitalea sp.]|jgi:sugar lactone lactonase YvrE